MPIYKGSNEVTGLWLGAKEITRVWKGTDLVYQKGSPPGPAEYTLFDNGWVSGVPWSGNLLPRPPYTTLVTYDFSLVDSNGFMRLMQEDGPDYSRVSHNAHVCTTNLITVPSGATKMFITCQRSSETAHNFNWGLVASSAANSMDGTGGQLSATQSWLSTDTMTTLSQTLNSGIAGGSFRFIVNSVNPNAWAALPGFSSLSIYKVWFE